jgi:hypothetical protein
MPLTALSPRYFTPMVLFAIERFTGSPQVWRLFRFHQRRRCAAATVSGQIVIHRDLFSVYGLFHAADIVVYRQTALRSIAGFQAKRVSRALRFRFTCRRHQIRYGGEAARVETPGRRAAHTR